MTRRHPALRTAGGVYLAALAVLCLTPNGLVTRATVVVRRTAPWAPASGVEFVLDALLFVPVGVFLVLIVGRRRWVTVILVGVIASCWVQLAEMVWMPLGTGEARSVVAHIAGCAIGVGVVGLAASMRHAGRPRSNAALSPISQSPGSRL